MLARMPENAKIMCQTLSADVCWCESQFHCNFSTKLVDCTIMVYCVGAPLDSSRCTCQLHLQMQHPAGVTRSGAKLKKTNAHREGHRTLRLSSKELRWPHIRLFVMLIFVVSCPSVEWIRFWVQKLPRSKEPLQTTLQRFWKRVTTRSFLIVSLRAPLVCGSFTKSHCACWNNRPFRCYSCYSCLFVCWSKTDVCE